VPYKQSFYPGWGGSRRLALDQISRPTRDRWTPRQSGQGHQDHPVRLTPIGGQTALHRKVQLSPKQVYKPKIGDEKVEERDVDPERTTSQDIIQIGTMDVSVGASAQKGSVASDHEASGSGSNSKYFLPRWCPLGLTHTQRRKIQRLNLREYDNPPRKIPYYRLRPIHFGH
jgi:hypothetical protein